MKFRIIASAMMLAIGFAGAVDAQAQRRERSQYGEEDQIVLQANRAYIFFRTPYRETYRFLREVTDSERAANEAEREVAFTRARTRAERRLADWESERRSCEGSISPICRQPRPVVPTAETFPWAPPEADNFVGNATRPRLIHQDDWSGWLIAVEPGTYSLYGAISEAANGPLTGTCFCMGSVRFEARAGVITDMGEIVMAPEDQRGTPTAQNFRLGHYVTVAPWNAQMRTPQQFTNLRVVPAELRAADRMPNYFGVMITRLAPIDGVLAYNRDEVIDLRAAATAQAGTD
ncbi:MAG: hypothetical protein JWL74_1267 [Alphaproteobacteria bacterium]|nr:hypothetical protein [Alphaproteobacteria bacterium]